MPPLEHSVGFSSIHRACGGVTVVKSRHHRSTPPFRLRCKPTRTAENESRSKTREHDRLKILSGFALCKRLAFTRRTFQEIQDAANLSRDSFHPRAYPIGGLCTRRSICCRLREDVRWKRRVDFTVLWVSGLKYGTDFQCSQVGMLRKMKYGYPLLGGDETNYNRAQTCKRQIPMLVPVLSGSSLSFLVSGLPANQSPRSALLNSSNIGTNR